jgi:glycerol-3-phosphate dehydrogenase (NAD(P)+)
MKSVAEGIATCQSTFELSQKLRVEMPNATFVYKILYEGLTPQLAVNAMLKRELKDEAIVSKPSPKIIS